MCKSIYISGAISGCDIQEVNKKFNSKEIELSRAGYHVINPLKIRPNSKTWCDYMLADIKHLFTANSIYMLKCWHNSKGARIEHKIAQEMGIEIIYEPCAGTPC